MSELDITNYFCSTDSVGNSSNITKKVKYKKGKPNSIITKEHNENGHTISTIEQKWNEKTQNWVTTKEIKNYPNIWLESYKVASRKNPLKTTTYTYYDNLQPKSVVRTNKYGEVTTQKEYSRNGKRIK